MGQLEWKDVIGPGGVLLASIITQLVTTILLFANNGMAYKRSRREKLWDLKRELYGKVISKVSEIETEYLAAETFYNFNQDEFDDGRKRSSEMEYNIFPKISQTQTIFQDNYLVFSRGFIRAFERIFDFTLYDPSQATKSYGDVLAERRHLVAKLHTACGASAQRTRNGQLRVSFDWLRPDLRGFSRLARS